QALAAQVVARLDELAEHDDSGVTWFTPPQFVPPHQLETWPQGYHNLGLAHGVPAVVGFLAQAAAMGNDRARQLAEESVGWIISRRLPGGDYSAILEEGPAPAPARLGWCYGNPGVASALLVAGQVLDRPEWRDVAFDIGRHSAARPDHAAGVVDPGLCHGAAGLALIYNHLFQASADDTFRDASAHWYERLLDMRRPGVGIAGYQAWQPPDLIDDPGVLTGAAGVALALHAGSTDVSPMWDAALLMSPAISG
ncbi:MAG: lanthionine synthetase C family protein, partial [Candidatus Dormibacteria bacterium]